MSAEQVSAVDYGDLAATQVDERIYITDVASGEKVILDRNEAIALRDWLNKVTL